MRWKTAVLYSWVAIMFLSVTVCLFTVIVLGREEASLGAEAVLTQRGGGLKYGVVNNQREILNVESDRSPVRRELPAKNEKGQDNAEGKQQSDTLNHHPATNGGGEGEERDPSSHSERQQNCSGPWPDFPECQKKMDWMAGNWEKDNCYAENGVDGSKCSFQAYLSEVEHWCPPLLTHNRGRQHTFTDSNQVAATPRYDIEPLKKQLSRNVKFDWLLRRISTHWPHWTAALKTLEGRASFNHSRKRVLIHIGALSDKANFKFAENADHGGPLGELVQWSDLIASLYLLGHSIDFSTELNQLRSFLEAVKGKGWCPTRTEKQYHVIYIDIVGLRQFKKLARNKLQHYQCLFRVLDSFGTEPQFNFRAWKPPNRPRGDYGQAWGNWNFNPRQFLTMYPHTPDNSFLGFVVGSNVKNRTALVKKNTALVYGKELYMWEGKRKYLDIISSYMDIHATIGTTQPKKKKVDPSVVPGYVINHGILDSASLQALLSETKVFIGLGFPYEGPAPLEAIANGCVFLNPRLSPALNRYNSQFLKGKPTSRALTSQNPYTENFIGQPYVYTFDMEDSQAVIAIMEHINKMKPLTGYLPYEFTYEGVLERVMVYLQNQDFCSTHQWPGEDSLLVRISAEAESCKDACYREGLVCEPELFSFLNKESAVNKHFKCSKIHPENSVHGPSHSSRYQTCSIQSTPLLQSCVGSESKVQRLCPCRTYRKGQVALCSTCSNS